MIQKILMVSAIILMFVSVIIRDYQSIKMRESWKSSSHYGFEKNNTLQTE